MNMSGALSDLSDVSCMIGSVVLLLFFFPVCLPIMCREGVVPADSVCEKESSEIHSLSTKKMNYLPLTILMCSGTRQNQILRATPPPKLGGGARNVRQRGEPSPE